MVEGNCPYIHPKAISFHSDQDRTNWINYMPDATSRDLFSNFRGSNPKYRKRTHIGLFCSPNGRLVGNEWEARSWHAYVIAIIGGTKKRILIWDCDPIEDASEGKRWKDVLWGKQRSFVEYVRKSRAMRGAEVWYSTDSSDSGKNECLPLSLRKIWEWATFGDMGYQGTKDPRFQSCVKLNA
ncbi:hypothetical protein F4806DRAFT_468792 [Annulohypoxylon nitens]|nr:hypothetical protein F4806DRAFT_468792 [Annulohypoxylon nitens]